MRFAVEKSDRNTVYRKVGAAKKVLDFSTSQACQLASVEMTRNMKKRVFNCHFERRNANAFRSREICKNALIAGGESQAARTLQI